jgi:hypothetical protein
MRDRLVAVVIPTTDTLLSHQQHQHDLNSYFVQAFEEVGWQGGLEAWETPRQIVITSADTVWGSANGLLTSTGKLKRSGLFAKYHSDFEHLAMVVNIPVSDKLLSDKKCAGKKRQEAEKEDDELKDERVEVALKPWQHCSIAGVSDYLDFTFTAENMDEAGVMNAIKAKMNEIIPTIRSRIGALDVKLKADTTAAKAELLNTQAEWNLLVTNEEHTLLLALSALEECNQTDAHSQLPLSLLPLRLQTAIQAMQSWTRVLSLRKVHILRAQLLEEDAGATHADHVSREELVLQYNTLAAELKRSAAKYRISIPAHIGES